MRLSSFEMVMTTLLATITPECPDHWKMHPECLGFNQPTYDCITARYCLAKHGNSYRDDILTSLMVLKL